MQQSEHKHNKQIRGIRTKQRNHKASAIIEPLPCRKSKQLLKQPLPKHQKHNFSRKFMPQGKHADSLTNEARDHT
jgi:hypothetical protein